MAQKQQTKQPAATAYKTKTGSIAANSFSTKTSSSTQTNQDKTLKSVFEDCLNDTYSAEKQLLQALPEMAKAADNEELQDAFEYHLEQTRKHVARIEKVFARLDITQSGVTCKAMEGLIEEGKKIMKDYKQGAVRDSAMIIGAQKIEHYEIAAYGSLCELADVLGHHKVHEILGRTLDEEEDTDLLLTEIARDVNDEAVEGVNEDEEEAEDEETSEDEE